MNHLGTRELATERLTLRRFEIEDAENMFYNWASDPEVTKYLTWPTHKSVEVTETIIKEWVSQYDRKDFYQWAIELNDLEQLRSFAMQLDIIAEGYRAQTRS